MPEYIVAIERITYYAVQATNEIDAIDVTLEDQGREVHQDTIDVYIDLAKTMKYRAAN